MYYLRNINHGIKASIYLTKKSLFLFLSLLLNPKLNSVTVSKNGRGPVNELVLPSILMFGILFKVQ